MKNNMTSTGRHEIASILPSDVTALFREEVRTLFRRACRRKLENTSQNEQSDYRTAFGGQNDKSKI